MLTLEYMKEWNSFLAIGLLSSLHTVQKSLKHRRVKHFGYEFHYENNNIDKDKPLPGGK